VRREGGRVGGVGGRWDSADDGNNFQRMSWWGKEKKRWESKREREREREVDTPATEDHTGVPADLSPVSTVFRTCTVLGGF